MHLCSQLPINNSNKILIHLVTWVVGPASRCPQGTTKISKGWWWDLHQQRVVKIQQLCINISRDIWCSSNRWELAEAVVFLLKVWVEAVCQEVNFPLQEEVWCHLLVCIQVLVVTQPLEWVRQDHQWVICKEAVHLVIIILRLTICQVQLVVVILLLNSNNSKCKEAANPQTSWLVHLTLEVSPRKSQLKKSWTRKLRKLLPS